MITAVELSLGYPGAVRPAVDRVSVSVQGGELLCVTGPNGSGKSTMIRGLTGSLAPMHGSASFQGRPIAAWRLADLARSLAVLPQRESMVFPLRVGEHVMLGRYPHLGPLGRESAHDRAIVRRALERCDAADLAERNVDTLSGGEWQRVRLARALAQQPLALILDEPTTNLDLGHEMQIFELLRQLADEGIAVLAVTHGLNLAAQFADRILLLERGRTAALGIPSAVIRTDVIEAVFGWPVDVHRTTDGAPLVLPRRRPLPPDTASDQRL